MNETHEKELNLKWLLYRILRAWKPILVWSIIIGLAMGISSFGTNAMQLTDAEFLEGAYLNYQREHAAWVVTRDNYNKRLSDLEGAKISQQEYNDKSIMMEINPMQKNVASFELYVKYDYQIDPNLTVQNPDLSSRILRSYATYMTNGEMYHYIMENVSYDIEMQYLTEILDISVDYNNNFITISVVHKDADSCQEILTLARTGIESRTQYITELIAEHTISLSNQVAYEVIDGSLQSTQEANRQAITNMDTTIQEVNAERLKWLKGYTDDDGNKVGGAEPVFEYTLDNTVKGAIKAMITGGVVGFLLLSVVVAVAAAMSGKLQNPEELKSQFGLCVIGALPRGRKNQSFAGICRAIARFGNITAKPEDYVPLAQTIGTSIRKLITAREDSGNWKKIAITGTAEEAKIKRVAELMAIGGGYTVVCASDVLTNADSIEKVSDADCVVLVEVQEKTVMANVEKELEALKGWKKPVLGAVVLNADAVM